MKAHSESFVVTVARFEFSAFAGSPEAASTLLRQLPVSVESSAPLDAFLAARRTATPATADAAIAAMRAAVASGKLWPQLPSPQYPLLAATMFGRIDVAFEVLDQYASAWSVWNRRYLFDPVTAPLRRDPRFWRVVAKLGLIDYWRARNVWPDFCADSTLPYDCRAEADRVAPRANDQSGART